MLTTKKALTAALSALVKLAPRRADFWGLVVVTDDTMTAALAGDCAAVTVSGEQAKDTSTLGVWELASGWKAAAEMVKKYPYEFIALEPNESGVLCVQGVEFARPVSLDMEAARQRVEELRPAHELARIVHDTAESERQAAYNALQEYGYELFPAGGWSLSERKRRPLTTDEEQRRAELSAAQDAARTAATAACNEFAAVNSAINAAGDMVRHIERFLAAQAFAGAVAGKLAQPALSVGSKEVKPLAQLADKFQGQQQEFRHVWAKDGTVSASDGYAVSSIEASGDKVAGAWGGGGLLDLVSIAGARGSLSLHADGWASCQPQRGVSVLARVAPDTEEIGVMPDFDQPLSGAKVVGQFAVYGKHGARLHALAGLFDEVAVSAGGVFFLSEQASGREAWEDTYHPMGAAEMPAYVVYGFSSQALRLLKLGGRFELLKPAAKGPYMLRRVECGTVAAGRLKLSVGMAALITQHEAAAPMPSLLEPASVPAETQAPEVASAQDDAQPVSVDPVEPEHVSGQEKPRYRLHLDGTLEHLSGPVLDVPEHRRYQPSAAPISAEQPARVSVPSEPVSVPSVVPVSAPAVRTKRRAPVRPVRSVVACLEAVPVGVAA